MGSCIFFQLESFIYARRAPWVLALARDGLFNLWKESSVDSCVFSKWSILFMQEEPSGFLCLLKLDSFIYARSLFLAV